MVPRLQEFFRFCIVGFIGFLTDAAGLEWFVHHGFVAPIARIFSLGIALQVTYLLHSLFTFRGHRGFRLRGWLHFLALNLLGAAINYGVFLGVWSLKLAGDSWLSRLVALMAGTAVALGFNYWSNGRFVFRKVKSE